MFVYVTEQMSGRKQTGEGDLIMSSLSVTLHTAITLSTAI